MASPWKLPPEPANFSRKEAAPEPFRVEADMAAIDLFLSETLLPLLGARIPLDHRLRQRGVGDLVEAVVADRIIEAAKGREGLEASRAPSRRSMEDVRLLKGEACVHVDVKTRNVDCDFSMPNIVSIQRLDRFYRKGSNVFVVLTAEYSDLGGEIAVENLAWHRIEEICWSCLSIRNLGQGQLQMSDARKPIRRFDGDRCAWMRRLHAEGAAFYGQVAERAFAAHREWLGKAATDDVD